LYRTLDEFLNHVLAIPQQLTIEDGFREAILQHELQLDYLNTNFDKLTHYQSEHVLFLLAQAIDDPNTSQNLKDLYKELMHTTIAGAAQKLMLSPTQKNKLRTSGSLTSGDPKYKVVEGLKLVWDFSSQQVNPNIQEVVKERLEGYHTRDRLDLIINVLIAYTDYAHYSLTIRQYIHDTYPRIGKLCNHMIKLVEADKFPLMHNITQEDFDNLWTDLIENSEVERMLQCDFDTIVEQLCQIRRYISGYMSFSQ